MEAIVIMVVLAAVVGYAMYMDWRCDGELPREGIGGIERIAEVRR